MRWCFICIHQSVMIHPPSRHPSMAESAVLINVICLTQSYTQVVCKASWNLISPPRSVLSKSSVLQTCTDQAVCLSTLAQLVLLFMEFLFFFLAQFYKGNKSASCPLLGGHWLILWPERMLIRNRVWQCSANYVLANSPVHLADLPTPFTFSHSYTCKPWRQPPIRRSDLFSTKTLSPTYRLTCQYRSTCNWRKEKLFFKRHCLILITWGVHVVGSNLVLQAKTLCV